MQSPAVSGVVTYPELCLVAKNEEKRLATLEQRHKHQHDKPGAVILSSLMKLLYNIQSFAHSLTLLQGCEHQNSAMRITTFG